MALNEPVPAPAAETARDPILALLDGSYRDPETGAPVRVATRALVIAESLAGMEAELVQRLGFGRKLAIVADPTTQAVLGGRIAAALSGRFSVDSVLLPQGVAADDATVANLRAATEAADALIAVGSGTINDLAKYASAQDGKPYAVFATAPSMNGYVSLTASITVEGHKLTLPAQAPAGAFFDLGVLAAAPKRMIRAGLGDSICRTTAEADWLLSHLLHGTPFRQLPFALLADDEAALLEQAAAAVIGDIAAMRTLARTLVLSGFGTAIVGSSAPASQGEHLISHFIDMREPAGRPPVLHGEQVGVTTLSMLRLQHALLDRPAITVRPDAETRDTVIARFGAELGQSVWDEFSAKRLDAAGADALNHTLATRWDDVRERLAEVLLPVARAEAIMGAAGAPATPEAIHLTRGFYETALRHGREIRNRYTALDLGAQSGVLDALLHRL